MATTTPANHSPSKRRNLLRWMENRERRLTFKLRGVTDPSDFGVPIQALYNDISPESIERCHIRRDALNAQITATPIPRSVPLGFYP